MISFALAIPTCADWIPERAESLARLHAQLGSRPMFYRELRERESNRVWPHKMWGWGADMGASHFLQLQDDVIPAPNFWPALRAMVEAQPDRIIGLHSNHPLAKVQQRAGRHWYRDQWITGPAYLLPTTKLSEFVGWCQDNPSKCAETNEDSLICKWLVATGQYAWHPVPAITTVDLDVPSTYGNDAHHEFSMYRTPPVTWRDAVTCASLEAVEFWRCTEEAAPILPGPGTQLCWFCGVSESAVTAQNTGARICKGCLFQCVGATMGIRVQG